MTDELTDDEVQTPLTQREQQLARLAKHRTATQFGGPRANPNVHQAGKNKSWSIRNSVRYFAAQRIDRDDKQAMTKLLSKDCTVAEYVAANSLTKAMKADMQAVEYVTEQIDGKLAQTSVNADFAAILRMTDDELIAIVAGGLDAISEGSGGSFGTEEAGGSAGDADGEAAGDAPTDDPASV